MSAQVSVSAAFFPTTDDYPILRRIDPYGDSIFNHLQIDLFLSEWDRAESFRRSEAERTIHNEIRELAMRCRREQEDVLLLFDGD
jgi:hypothetical protein